MTFKYDQGHWKWHEQVKLNEYYHRAKFNIYRIHSIRVHHEDDAFATLYMWVKSKGLPPTPSVWVICDKSDLFLFLKLFVVIVFSYNCFCTYESMALQKMQDLNRILATKRNPGLLLILVSSKTLTLFPLHHELWQILLYMESFLSWSYCNYLLTLSSILVRLSSQRPVKSMT